MVMIISATTCRIHTERRQPDWCLGSGHLLLHQTSAGYTVWTYLASRRSSFQHSPCWCQLQRQAWAEAGAGSGCTDWEVEASGSEPVSSHATQTGRCFCGTVRPRSMLDMSLLTLLTVCLLCLLAQSNLMLRHCQPKHMC